MTLDPQFHALITRQRNVVAFPAAQPTVMRVPDWTDAVNRLHRAAHTIHTELADFLMEAHLETDTRRLTEIEHLLEQVVIDALATKTAVVDRADRLRMKEGA